MIIRAFIYAAPLYVLLDREAGGVMTTVCTLQVRTFQAGHSGLAHAEAPFRTRDRGSFHPTS